MNFDKEFSDIYYECCCAGAAGGANCISSFAPENNKGVVDIHEKDKDLKESKMKESFDFEDDDDLGYDDFDYEGEMEDYYNPREYWPENAMEQMWAEEDDALIADSGIPVVKSNIFGKDTDNLSDEYMSMLDADLGVEKAVDHSSVYDYDKLEPSEIAIDPKLLGESKVMPRSIRESRALIGGSLESKEKTDYENTLEEHNKKRSYNKTVDSIDQKLTGVDSGAHGKHEWTGELIK